MAKNENLHKAKEAKKDEFYTQYEDIQNEINHFEHHFQGKTVLCNCDDPFESNFCKFFLRNFNYLKLKRLICTSYSTSPVIGQQLTLFDWMNEPVQRGNGYVMDITEVPMANGRGVSDADIDSLLRSKKRGVKKLKGDGDFRSDECIGYLKQADIVVTNPPFSLFREYVAQLIEYNKSFLIIGSKNAITYKEIFPLIKNNQMWLGPAFNRGNAFFKVPKDNLRDYANGVYDAESGLVKFRNVGWYTNLDFQARHEELILYKKYYGNEEEYPKYDNYDAINVDKTADIPCDYFEKMGVPITYLDKHNPEQFDLISADFDVANPVDLGNGKRGTGRFYLENLQKTLDTSNEIGDTLTDRQTDSCADYTAELLSDARCSGIMGVPITFLDKYNPDQFEILGITQRNDDPYKIKRYTTQEYTNANDLNARAVIIQKNGIPKTMYARILIKRRQNHED